MDPAFFEALYGVVTVFCLGFFIRKSLTTHHTLRWWFLFGLSFNLFSLSWLYTTYPLIWFPGGVLQLVALSLFLIILAVIAGIAFLPVGYTFVFTKPSWKQAFLFSFLLMIGETVRSLLFSILLFGNGGKIGLHYNAGTIGTALSPTPLIEFAYLGGVYMLTFILGFLLYTFLFSRYLTRWYMGIVVTVVALFILHTSIPVHQPIKDIRIGIITTSISNPTDDDLEHGWLEKRYNELDAATMRLASTTPDFITYPEDAEYIKRSSPEKLALLAATFPHTVFIDGSTEKFAEGFSNFSIAFDPTHPTQELGRGKVFLFPFNEYVPAFLEPIVRLFFSPGQYSIYQKEHTYTPFASMTTFTIGGLRIGTLLCSELSSFQTIFSLAAQHPDIVIAQSNLSVFRNNPWFGAQYRAYVKIAAAQTRTFTISDANKVESYVISPKGNILYTLRASTTQSYIVNFSASSSITSLVHIP